jgi:hypothetical protein
MSETEKMKPGEGNPGGIPSAKDWRLSDLLPVLEALRGLRFGSVELFIQDSRLVQIDRKEKIRSFKN